MSEMMISAGPSILFTAAGKAYIPSQKGYRPMQPGTVQRNRDSDVRVVNW
jgi:hypothetical protein